MQNVKYCNLCEKTFTELGITYCPYDATLLSEMCPIKKEGKSIPIPQKSGKVDNFVTDDPNRLILPSLLGLVGSLILFFGVFTPIISLPVVGSLNYFHNGRGDGVIILVIAIFSVVLTLTKRYIFLFITGGGSLAILAFLFISFYYHMSQMQSQMKRVLGNNPFAPSGETMVNAVQVEWGWAILIIGATLLIAAAWLKPTESEVESTQEDDTLSFGGINAETSLSKESVLAFILGIIIGVGLGMIASTFVE